MPTTKSNWRPVRPGILWIPEDDKTQPALLGGQCEKCETIIFPYEAFCHGCYDSDTVKEIKLSRHGTLYSYTILRSAPPGFTAPYAVGYIDLPEGVRLFSQIVNCNFDCLTVGMEVELVVGPLRRTEEGVEIIGYKFRPVSFQ